MNLDAVVLQRLQDAEHLGDARSCQTIQAEDHEDLELVHRGIVKEAAKHGTIPTAARAFLFVQLDLANRGLKALQEFPARFDLGDEPVLLLVLPGGNPTVNRRGSRSAPGAHFIGTYRPLSRHFG
jgi:hypothetical protein